MNPNHYLAVAIQYLYGGARPGWRDGGHRQDAGVVVDDRPGRRRPGPAAGRGAGRLQVVRARAARRLGRVRRRGVGRRVVPAARRVGVDHRQGRHPARPARLGDPRRHRPIAQRALRATSSQQHGEPAYARVDAPATREEKAKLAKLSPDDVTATELAGEPITAKLTAAPGNGAAIGGLKVTTESAWFAARPVGHRGRLQDLRRVLPRARAPGPGAGRGPRGRLRRPRRLSLPWRARLGSG